MTDGTHWQDLIAAADTSFPTARALTYLGRYNSDSMPVRVMCDDGNIYVVKSRRSDRDLAHFERVLVNDHVVAALGHLLGAPVGQVALIDVPEELIKLEPMMSHLLPGLGHGTRLLARCGDRAGIAHCDVSENRRRFATLAVLYGWALANDRQVIYEDAPPHLVHSLDHGHFFPGGPIWNQAGLKGAPPAVLDDFFVSGSSLTPEELANGLNLLSSVSDEAIAKIVAVPPPIWGLTEAERVVLADYLGRRRDDLVPGTP